MAKIDKKVVENIAGEQFVDSSCINCDVCRKFAPEIFGNSGQNSYIKKDIKSEDEWLQFQRALLSCPVKAIGDQSRRSIATARDTLPFKLSDGIYINGFNDRSSFGADSYFLTGTDGNWMVDSPSFNRHLVKKIENLGGIKYIYLSHRDDVADCQRYAKHFGAKIIIHQDDSDAVPDAEIVIVGEQDHTIGDSARIIVVPGHTKGHMLLLWRECYLFTGDHFAWSPSEQRFLAFKDYCWYNWEEQKRSIAKMISLTDVTHIFPGHGRRGEVGPGEFPAVVKSYLNSL
ncbi:MAG: MBL fold metallo-hydrolase [Bdellovibrionales bacterium]|nr:MBL fold metallo-hydrolase [Bdellovibrionales bacterium]MBT3527153.1 MBL fold metallo-hydrolase [Bdellovibrionales bacterium]MBT7670383.1 MBL fold metallo-hydrolase [Bdellovibrionales bacterium]MBT7765539.1 MBL fold metallo-hydrolase [Bdellovibrionales bacterium]